METPSDDNKVTEDQNDNAGEDAKTDPAVVEPPEPTAEELAGDQAASDAEDREAEVAVASWGGLPEYKCHKVVTAFLIASTEPMSNGQIRLVGADPAHAIIVGSDYVDKHRPQIGGYYVRYHDGYQSWSPAAAFEGGYTLVD